MRQTMKKSFVALLAICVLMLSSVTVCFAASAEDGVGSDGGLNVKITTDAESYGTGDTVKMQIAVENTNSYEVKNVNVSMAMPDGLKEATKDELVVKTLAAGETQTLTKELTVTKAGAAGSSKSGGSDSLWLIIGIIAAVVVVVAVIVVVIVLKKKKGKNVAAGMIIVALLATSAIGISPMEAQAAAPTTGHVSVHDPSIVKDTKSGTYYIFGSHRAWAKTDDLMTWKSFTNNLTSNYKDIFGDLFASYNSYGKNTTVDGNMWAPDVIWNEAMNKWCMYMSINGDNWQSTIYLLTADSLDGDWTLVAPVVYSGFTGSSSEVINFNVFKNVKVGNDDLRIRASVSFSSGSDRASMTDVYKVLGEGADLSSYARVQSVQNNSMLNAIDPNVNFDDEGNMWLAYGSWSAGIYQIKLDPKTGLRDYTYKYETKNNESDAYFGKKLAGGYYSSGEGAYILKYDKYYFLFMSYAGLSSTEGYQMRVFRSEDINGPYVDAKGVPAIYTAYVNNVDGQRGYKLMSSVAWSDYSKIEVAQGHNSAFVDEDGKAYVIYHTRFVNNNDSYSVNNPIDGHEVRVHQLWLNDEGWLVAAPFEYTGETLPENGYTAAEIAGDYEFAIHETRHYSRPKKGDVVDATAKASGIIEPKNITLTADGKITGDVEGTWKSSGKSVTLSIDGTDYNGVAIKQYSEKQPKTEKMCITLEGNNKAAWAIAK